MHQDREPTFFHFNKPIKMGLQKIALHNHTTLTSLLEEGAKMVIHKENLRMKEDMMNLESIHQMSMSIN